MTHNRPTIEEGVAQSVGELDERLSIERWLLASGLVPETVQENLVAFGWLSSEKVNNVEISLDVNKRTIHYVVSLLPRDLSKYKKFARKLVKYSASTSLWGKFIYLRLLKKGVKMNIEGNLKRFISDYLPDYSVSVEVKASG